MNVNELTTKRFVIRKSLIGKNVIITFTNKKGKVCKYNHDEVYYNNQERFDNMKLKFNHEQMASISALAVIATVIIFVTFVK